MASILSDRDKYMIKGGEWLEDTHMDYFGALVRSSTNYSPRETWRVQCPDTIEPVSNINKHVQILHSGYGIHDGHWVCSYYDGNRIYVYDSLNRQRLHEHHKIYLHKLYPFYPFDEKPVKFPNVQQQPNGNDCGVFAIAFAVSLVFGLKPDTIRYDHCSMRSHLLTMFESYHLDHFPQDPHHGPMKKILPLQVVLFRDADARRKRKYRNNAIEKHSWENQKDETNKKRRLQYSNDAATKCSQERENYKMNKENKQKQKRKNYADNAEEKREIARKNYNINLDKRRETARKNDDMNIKRNRENARKRDAVNVDKNRENARKRDAVNVDKNRENARKRDAVNVNKNRENARKRDAVNVDKNRENARKRDAVNVDKNREATRTKYNELKENKRDKKRTNYDKNRERFRGLKRKNYHDNIEENRLRKRIKYSDNCDWEQERKKNFNCINFRRKQTDNKNYYNRNKEKILTRIKINAVKQIASKYKKIELEQTTIKMSKSRESYITSISKKLLLASEVECRLQAEKIIEWCVHVRIGYVAGIKRTLALLKTKAEACLTRALQSYAYDSGEEISALCGQTKHNPSSEPYFREAAYSFMHFSEPFIMNNKGQAMNILPLMKEARGSKKSWHCSKACKNNDPFVIQKLKHFLTVISISKLRNIRRHVQRSCACSVKFSDLKLGHSHSCYIDQTICRSTFLAVQLLSPHFPRIRHIERLFYELMNLDKKLSSLDSALNACDLNVLQEISSSARQNANNLNINAEGISLNEDEISSRLSHAFKVFTKRALDAPRHACISCEKLCYKRDVSDLNKLRKAITGDAWNNLMKFRHTDVTHTSQETQSSFVSSTGYTCHPKLDHICRYCLKKFRDGSIPSTCVLNKLSVDDVPSLIDSLNDYERILIQRAKAFQVIQTMKTVSRKNLPNKEKIKKVHGRTFHLPLPVEETMRKICSSTEAINKNHELYILVRGIPTKAKVVWEKLVDVKKVFETLSWLKNNNPLYFEIQLPNRSEDLLDSCENDVEFTIDNVEGNKQALLTQVTDPEIYYEHFTIYPMHEKKVNATATDLYQMLKVQDVPLDNRYKDLDLKCFPDLYPYGKHGQKEDRKVKLTDFEYIKLRLMSRHSRFRLNQQYLFYLLNDNNMRQLSSGIFQKMNVLNPREKYTAASYLDKLSKEELESNLTTIFSRLRNTQQYWQKPRNELRCMTQHYGPATWFLTLSPAEWLWSDLEGYIREVNPSFPSTMTPSTLIAADPISTSRFIENKFRAMLDFICSPDNPIGEITHYFWRREYQGRGIQHFHLLLWVKDAPILGKSSIEEVSQFILKYVTCRMPDRNVSPLLYRRVDTHQRHRHNDYCLRRKTSKAGKVSRVCRFGFSRPITNNMVIRDIATSIAGRRKLKTRSRLYDLPRRDIEANINDYNPAILTVWEGNMDIQFVGEKSALLNWYINKYTTKSESSTVSDTFDTINSTKSAYSRLWNIALRSISNRECGALEAADTLLGIPLHGTDPNTTIRWLDVNQIRSRKVKSLKEVQALEEGSTDIFCPSLIDDYYPTRPFQLESINLYDFAKWFDISKVKPANPYVESYKIGNNLYIKRRLQHGYLINHYRYNINNQPERYFFALLLLFQPWRDINELKNNCDTYAEAFYASKSTLTDAVHYHKELEEIQIAFDHAKELVEKKMETISQEVNQNSQNNSLDCRPVEAAEAMQDFKHVGDNLETLDVERMISQLNSDQKRIFDAVIHTVQSDNEILRLYVSGEGGTGKSFLIKILRHWLKQNLCKNTAVTAPTGIAAFNINGLTVHRLFQLPVEHGHTPKYTPLSDIVLKTLRNDLKEVVLVIIDEVSMISNITLMYIHLRLAEIFDTTDSDNGWFGGKHILLFGDLLQLPPVYEEPAFAPLPKAKLEKYLGSLGTINLWTTLFTYDELTISVRQQNDTPYRELLSRIRIGIVTDNDSKTLESRQIHFKSSTAALRLKELCTYINKLSCDAVCLLPTRHMCDVLNAAVLQEISSDEITLMARDTIDCPVYLKKKVSALLTKNDDDSSRTAGLSKIIIIKIGAKIMIRRNIDVTLGLVNGTIGQVTSVQRSVDGMDIEAIKIKLPTGNEYSIERVTVKFQVIDRAFVFRKQFPVSLSYGITIHKSQGLTLNHAIIDAGNRVFSCGQIYVALSRVTSIDGVHLINYDPQSVKASELAIVEYNRLKKLYKPEVSEIPIPKKRCRKRADFVWIIDTNVIDIQKTVEEKTSEVRHSVKGLKNIDNVSCYVNAIMQCIVHCALINKTLRSQETSDALSRFISHYTRDDSIDSFEIRQFAGDKFCTNTQRDASEFLAALCDKSCSIGNIIDHQLITTIRCNTCGQTSTDNRRNFILSLPISSSAKSINLQDVINSALSHWQQVDDDHCEKCHETSKIRKYEISLLKSVVVLKLLLNRLQDDHIMKLETCKIKEIPTSKLSLGENKYKVTSAVFHHGQHLNSGHYTSMLRDPDSGWIFADDSEIIKKSWPKCAKDAYMFFLQKIP